MLGVSQDGEYRFLTAIVDRHIIHIRQGSGWEAEKMTLEDWRKIFQESHGNAAIEQERERPKKTIEDKAKKERLESGPGMEGRLTP